MAGAGGLIAATSGAAPAGLAAADRMWCFAAGVAAVAAAARARRWTWCWLSLVTIVSAGTYTALAAGAAAAAIGVIALRHRIGLLGACVAVLCIGALLRQPDHGVRFSSAAVTALAVAPLAISGYLQATRRARRRVKLGLLFVFASAFAASAAFGIAAQRSAGDISAAVDHLDRGVQRMARLDQPGAAADLHAGADRLARADTRLHRPWARAARVVPVVGHQARAAMAGTAAAHQLAGAATAVVDATDAEQLRLRAGAVDLDQLDRVRAPLTHLATVAEAARARFGELGSPWHPPALSERIDEAAGMLERFAPVAGRLARTVEHSDVLFGKTQPQRYFVGFTTPAEARGSGGLLGSYAIVEIDAGRFSVARSGRIEDLNARLSTLDNPPLREPAGYAGQWGRFHPEQHFQDLTLSPDFPAVGEVIAQLYARATGEHVDGAITVDPYGVAALLKVVGPVTLASGTRLDAASTAGFLLRDQYAAFAQDSQRVDALGDAASRTIAKLLTAPVELGETAIDSIGPAVAQRRIVLWHGNPAIEKLFDSFGATGRLPQAGPTRSVFATVHQNSGQNKIDAYLHRTITYSIAIDSRGRRTARATIVLHNAAPARGLPNAVIGSNDQGLAPGTNRMLLSLYTDFAYVASRVDGARTPMETGAEGGLNAFSLSVEIPAGSTRTVEIDLVDSHTGPPGGCLDEITVWSPPGANPDAVSVVLDAPGGAMTGQAGEPGVRRFAVSG